MNRTERSSNTTTKSRTRSSNGRTGTSTRSRMASAVNAGVEKISRGVESLGQKMESTGRNRSTVSGARKRSTRSVTGSATASSRRGRSMPVGLEKRPVGRPAHLPIDNYGTLSIPQIRSRLTGLKKADLRKVMNFERRHRGRQTIISHIERRLKAA